MRNVDWMTLRRLSSRTNHKVFSNQGRTCFCLQKSKKSPSWFDLPHTYHLAHGEPSRCPQSILATRFHSHQKSKNSVWFIGSAVSRKCLKTFDFACCFNIRQHSVKISSSPQLLPRKWSALIRRGFVEMVSVALTATLQALLLQHPKFLLLMVFGIAVYELDYRVNLCFKSWNRFIVTWLVFDVHKFLLGVNSPLLRVLCTLLALKGASLLPDKNRYESCSWSNHKNCYPPFTYSR